MRSCRVKLKGTAGDTWRKSKGRSGPDWIYACIFGKQSGSLSSPFPTRLTTTTLLFATYYVENLFCISLQNELFEFQTFLYHPIIENNNSSFMSFYSLLFIWSLPVLSFPPPDFYNVTSLFSLIVGFLPYHILHHLRFSSRWRFFFLIFWLISL